LIPLTDEAEMKRFGLPFKTTDAVRWHFRHRVERGTAEAFVRDGSRIYVDPDTFYQLIRRAIA
jgi:hypothetical protein